MKRMPQSKEQIAAYMQEYTKKNKEQKAAYDKEYYIKNKDTISARVAIWQEDNKEKRFAQLKVYREKNKEVIKKYYENNKEQITAKNKEWRKKNKEQQAAYWRKKKYGLLPEDYDAMLEEQDNKCKICLVEFINVTPNIDHCHITNKVRGILCGFCNRGLGIFKDNTKLLTKAVKYLEENK
jgi:hypothetical protein